jgi:hypothetical protein
MNTDNWKYYYKLTTCGNRCESNLLYTPLVNESNTVMCMHYCIDKKYRSNTPENLTEELVNWFFNREVIFLKELSKFKFTPEVYDIDYNNQKIYIEFYGETLSNIVNDSNRDLNKELPEWKEQILNICNTLIQNSYYKISLYPHSFYIDTKKNIKTIDYFSVVPFSERYIHRSKIDGVIGTSGKYRFDDSTNNGMLDLKKVYEITLIKHLPNYWSDHNFLNSIADTITDNGDLNEI